MKTTSRKKTDEFSLFNTTSLPDSSFLETKLHSAEPGGLRCVSERTLCGA